MNTKRILTVSTVMLLVVALLASSLLFSSCDLLFSKQTTYIYSDAKGEHSKTVDFGEVLDIEKDALPLKDVYKFLGWFDKAEGGTQFVNEKGEGLSTPTKKGEFRLYTQYEALQFAIQLHAPKGTVGLTEDYFTYLRYGNAVASE